MFCRLVVKMLSRRSIAVAVDTTYRAVLNVPDVFPANAPEPRFTEL